MRPLHDIVGDVVARAAEKVGCNVTYLWGDWSYIADTLTRWNASEYTAGLKYPCICLYSPYEERRTMQGGREQSEATLELLIMVNTLKDYTNEERDAVSFENVLRPIYRAFISSLMDDPRIVRNYSGVPAHTYTENYRYGRLGVLMADNRPFADFLDVIEIRNLSLTFKESCNNG